MTEVNSVGPSFSFSIGNSNCTNNQKHLQFTNIWNAAKYHLNQDNRRHSNAEIQKETERLMKATGQTEASARRMFNGSNATVNQDGTSDSAVNGTSRKTTYALGYEDVNEKTYPPQKVAGTITRSTQGGQTGLYQAATVNGAQLGGTFSPGTSTVDPKDGTIHFEAKANDI